MITGRSRIHMTIQHFLLMASAFAFPFLIKLVPVLLILLFLNWLAEGNFRKRLQRIKNKEMFWVFILPYFIYLAGLIHTKNYSYAVFDLQVKASLLLLPFVLATSAPEQSRKNIHVLLAFVAGCLFSSLLCIGGVLQNYFSTGDVKFFYTDLSRFMHPAYFAMYLSFAIAVLLWIASDENLKRNHRIAAFSLAFFFWVMILFLQSKAGILVSFLIFLVVAFFAAFRKKRVWVSLLSLLLIISSYHLLMKYVVTLNHSRVYIAEYVVSKMEIDKTKRETNQIRVAIWQASLQLIKKNFLFGTGTGDIKDALLDEYIESGISGAYEYDKVKKEYTLVLNSHNQFLQTFATLGIAGFLSLTACFVMPLVASLRQKNYLYILFLLISGANFMFESMLEVQAGVMFFAVFNSFLYFVLDR